MKQCEIWLTDLSPVKGSEQAGVRPVVIISGNMMNRLLPVVIIAPLTSKIKRYKGNPVLKTSGVNGLKKESEILVSHIRSISKDRLLKRQGKAEESEIQQAIATLNDLLKYD